MNLSIQKVRIFYEKTQILGMGNDFLSFYDHVHRIQAQIEHRRIYYELF